mgnify:CR=1 FL=1|jgi:IclR family transcriptional regulator, KDG regulon repressor
MSSVPAVDRAIDLLYVLAETKRPMPLVELSERTGSSRSTVFNTLATLHQHGFVEKDERYKTYRLGVSVFELGNAYLAGVSLVPAFYEQARKLVDACGETVKLVIRDGRDVVYLGKQEGSHSVRLVAQVGTRLPAHFTAVGKVLLAQLSDDEVRELYAGYIFPARTPNAVMSVDELLVRLAPVRLHGHAYDDEESSVGVHCVAAPICDHTGGVLAAMSIGVPSERLGPGRMDELTALIRTHAGDLSRTLGCMK